mgnify:CR=1 FL=1
MALGQGGRGRLSPRTVSTRAVESRAVRLQVPLPPVMDRMFVTATNQPQPQPQVELTGRCWEGLERDVCGGSSSSSRGGSSSSTPRDLVQLREAHARWGCQYRVLWQEATSFRKPEAGVGFSVPGRHGGMRCACEARA